MLRLKVNHLKLEKIRVRKAPPVRVSNTTVEGQVSTVYLLLFPSTSRTKVRIQLQKSRGRRADQSCDWKRPDDNGIFWPSSPSFSPHTKLKVSSPHVTGIIPPKTSLDSKVSFLSKDPSERASFEQQQPKLHSNALHFFSRIQSN